MFLERMKKCLTKWLFLKSRSIPTLDRITQGPDLASYEHLLHNSGSGPGPLGFGLLRGAQSLQVKAPEMLKRRSVNAL